MEDFAEAVGRHGGGRGGWRCAMEYNPGGQRSTVSSWDVGAVIRRVVRMDIDIRPLACGLERAGAGAGFDEVGDLGGCSCLDIIDVLGRGRTKHVALSTLESKLLV